MLRVSIWHEIGTSGHYSLQETTLHRSDFIYVIGINYDPINNYATSVMRVPMDYIIYTCTIINYRTFIGRYVL